jgi:hypothetical protein
MELACYHKIPFCAAQYIDVKKTFCLGLCQRRLEIAVEAVLDDVLGQSLAVRSGHGGVGKVLPTSFVQAFAIMWLCIGETLHSSRSLSEQHHGNRR